MILLGFPGIGKTHLHGGKYIDLESMSFHRDDEFMIDIYMETAKWLGKTHIVLLVYHYQLVDYILENGYDVLAIVPTLDQKKEYFRRYRNRNQEQTRIFMESNFENVLADMKRLPYKEIRGYLSNAIKRL